MRNIDARFINDLRFGELSYFLERVKGNDELCLEIRKKYINIYYRGGNLLKITQNRAGYSFFFDAKYCLNKENDVHWQKIKALNTKSANDYVENFDLLMQEMDEWFLFHPKAEREFQHNLLKTNGSIIDIEYQIKSICRLDMLLYHDNKLVIVENKFGIGAVGGSASVAKHYQDMCNIIENEETRNEIINSAINITSAKYQLGLSSFYITPEDIEEIEILFLFANFNERSKGITGQINQIQKSLEAKILFMDQSEALIDYENARDLFAYENHNS